jgi:hypothetical protein
MGNKSNSNHPTNNIQRGGNGNRPNLRDDLDSRKNEEQDTKGNDVTHNEKQVRSDKANDGRKGS